MPSIVVIEDDETLRRNIERILCSAQYDVSSAPDGQTGLELVRRVAPQLVVCDIVMPGMDGLEVLRALKQDELTRTIPFLFLTARAEREEQRRGMNLGAADYLTKPFDFDDLLEAVQARLTEHAALTHSMERKLEELRGRNLDKDKLFSIVAHDLKGSFSGLLGACECLEGYQDQLGPDGTKRLINILNSSARASYQQLLDLLDWARVQIGALPWNPAALTVAEISEAACRSLEVTAKLKDLTLVNEVPASLGVRADRQMLHSILHNLVSNALKFTRRGGTITVSAHQAADTVVIDVRDTGVGMSPEAVLRAFVPTQNTHTVGTGGELGTGLGLLLCRELATMNGGTITVDSVPDVGTHVQVILPDAGSRP